MSTLSREEILQRLGSNDLSKRLVITPLLEPDQQIGPASIDLRLGTSFRGDLRTRAPIVDTLRSETRPVETFFDQTYRDFGERFVAYPGQLVLAASFEYIRLPNDIFGLLTTRSSVARLGIKIASIVQPGYVGTLTLELTNQSSNPVALYPGLRVVQLSLMELSDEVNVGYIGQLTAKYVADLGPKVSALDGDAEKLFKWGMR